MKTNVFVSFDFDYDQDLKILFCGQAEHDDTPFHISDMSIKRELSGDWEAKAKEKIKKVDQVVVICGEKTHTATGVTIEMKLAQELGKPYFLLEGRKLKTCTKPLGAKQTDKMYSWTWANVGSLLKGNR